MVRTDLKILPGTRIFSILVAKHAVMNANALLTNLVLIPLLFLIADIENHDFRLQPGSPAIDAGCSTGTATDFKNDSVPMGEARDIGAYEFVPLKFTAEPAPEWTALFERTSGWFGADGIFSIPLDGKEYQCMPDDPGQQDAPVNAAIAGNAVNAGSRENASGPGSGASRGIEAKSVAVSSGSEARSDATCTGNEASPGKNCSDRKTLFLFSDTYIGEVVDNVPQPGNVMVNNSAAWLTGTLPREEKIRFTYRKNTDGSPATYFIPANRNTKPGQYFWLGDGFINQENENALYVFAYHVEMTGPNVFDFAQTDIALLKIKDPSPNGLPEYEQFATDLGFVHPDHGRVYFGSGIFVNTRAAEAPDPDGYVYIYGILEKEKSLIAARVRPQQIEDFGQWRFWNGTGWSADKEEVAPITNAVSNELSVTPSGDGRYLLTFTVLGLSDKVGIRIGTSPTGPFGEIHEVYTCPEYAEKGLLPYNAKAHYHLSTPGRLLVSYNTITFDFWEDIQKDATIYHPRFIWVNY